jgi:hypothetical protein
MSRLKLKFLGLAFALVSLVALGGADLAVAQQSCPPPHPFQGVCIQVITYAQNPGTGVCCVYPNPCSAPGGWDQYFTLEECQAAG